MNDIQINERQGVVRTALTKLNRQDTNMNSPPNSKVTSTWKSADELFGNFAVKILSELWNSREKNLLKLAIQ